MKEITFTVLPCPKCKEVMGEDYVFSGTRQTSLQSLQSIGWPMCEHCGDDLDLGDTVPDHDSITITWQLSDIEEEADDMGTGLGISDCRVVMERLLKEHDADVGINWGMVRAQIHTRVRELDEEYDPS
jgi:hypothetical protein